MDNFWLNRLNDNPKVRSGEVTRCGNGLQFSYLIEWSSPEAKARWMARQAERKARWLSWPSDPDEAED